MSDQTALQTDISKPTPKAVISAQTLISEIISFFRWWYVEMPTWYVGLIQRVAILCDDTFSITLLLRTFFVPWHRDTSWVGYGFGIAIRLIYIPLAAFITAIILITLIAIAILWALLPIISIYSLARSPFL